ncbi:16S rRNA (cytosine(1407)-C(5))-methyltransferase RsmF [Motilimonas cestriensis]|uniref:Ribosomal RNA small subunit methyltransferase F n=1 Tax=Motilimonas cestriensis TaxID=2742685 RepID=A0ABS8W8B7_9GAMM|nr:16S rRNA (cytosine(1407)-C(5))-methyltransferase RsmF [Motilimonas cestriensis]
MANQIYLPDAFLSCMAQIMPNTLSMDDFIAICNQPLRRSIRVNTLKISVDAFKQRALEHQWQLSPIPWCDHGFWLIREDESIPLGNTAEHLAGLFYIQEASSMMPVTALFHLWQSEIVDPIVLDAAAAPGSKTTQIAALMNNQGLLIANEFSSSRVKVLHSNLMRCGIKNTALTHFDARVFGSWLTESVDAILLDAPCSGEGAVRKDDNAMKNWSESSVTDIANTQKALIESAFYALKPGGTLIYSTCTLNETENQEVCQHLLETFGDAVAVLPLTDLFPEAASVATPQGYLHVWPQVFDSEGFFVAGFRKLESAQPDEKNRHRGKFPFSFATKEKTENFFNYLSSQFGVTADQLNGDVCIREAEYWLFPKAFSGIKGKMKYDRVGIKLAEAIKKSFRITHELALVIGQVADKNTFELSAAQCKEYYMGRDIHLDQVLGKGEVILLYRGAPIGLGKWVNNRIKNSYPRELVRDYHLFDF